MFKALNEALRSEKPSIYFWRWFNDGSLKRLLPELARLKQAKQDPSDHPEGDVFTHTLKALDFYDGDPIGRWVLLLHDLGKGTTHKLIDGHHDYPGHDEKSVQYAVDIVQRIGMPVPMAKKVLELVRVVDGSHLLAEADDDAVKEFVRHPLFPLFMRVAYAGEASRGPKPEVWDKALERLKKIAVKEGTDHRAISANTPHPRYSRVYAA